MSVQLGIEVLLRDQQSMLRGARLGALVHPASIMSNLQHTANALFQKKSFRLVCLLGPQHGARGEKQENMIESAPYRDPVIQLPVHSLYSSTRRPTRAMLEDLDVLVCDLQDVGTRVYTFIYSMAYCMEACAQFGKRMVVLDRPNPINGLSVEGNLLQPDFRSFVGEYPLPMRHGLTIGELALLINREYGIGCDLTVVAMKGWRRNLWWDDLDLPWVNPSPNMPTLASALVYPGSVLVEGTTFSEGRGTTRPFEIIGAPYIQSHTLADHLKSLELPGVDFRPCYFEPTFQKHAGVTCGGIQIHVTDREIFEPYLTGIAIVSAVKALYPDHFCWSDPPYEYEYQKRPMEILCGGRTIPNQIESGVAPIKIRETWQADVVRFLRQRTPYLLYE